jgi:hypothetical protein
MNTLSIIDLCRQGQQALGAGNLDRAIELLDSALFHWHCRKGRKQIDAVVIDIKRRALEQSA